MNVETVNIIKRLVKACNDLANERIFIYGITGPIEGELSIHIECNNNIYRKELRTLVTLIDMLNSSLELEYTFENLH